MRGEDGLSLFDELAEERTGFSGIDDILTRGLGRAEGRGYGVQAFFDLSPFRIGVGGGFDLLDLLSDISFKIIFITASDAHGIKAFRYAAIDYLLKPIDPDELVEALKKFRESGINENDKYQFLNESLKNHNKPNERLALHSQDKIQIVEISSILRCESSVNYTTFFFIDGKQIVVTRTLKEFGDLLGEQGFFRVHQSHLVNTKHIKEYVKSEGGHLIMNDGNLIPVSVRKRPEVMKMLDRL